MKAKKQLKKLRQYLKSELITSKLQLDNGCFSHDSLKEEAVARAKYETLLNVYTELIYFKEHK